jgi:beta-lactamase regulating signal transducer with metallopeptidase domain
MMYWLRFAVVCASVFILLYGLLSALLALGWTKLKQSSIFQSAEVLFILRVVPCVTALIVLAFVVVPSFWVLEPSATDEWIGLWAALLSLACVIWIAMRAGNLYSAWRSTSRIFERAVPRKVPGATVPVFELRDSGANLFVAGVLRPRLLISRRAIELLDADELQAAIRHELAHARSADNLKQMVVRFCSFPFLSSLDRAWFRAVEIAADDRSVTDALTAADLASALIKVGTESAALTPELGMSLVPEADTPVSDRVQRLLAWKSATGGHAGRFAVGLLLLQAAAVAVNVGWLVPQMHRFTELLFQ